MPADGTRAANKRTGDFGTSPIFVQLSDKPLLASTKLSGVPERKVQCRIEKSRITDLKARTGSFVVINGGLLLEFQFSSQPKPASVVPLDAWLCARSTSRGGTSRQLSY